MDDLETLLENSVEINKTETIPDYNAEMDVPLYNQQLQQCLNGRQNAYMTELGGWHQQLDMIFHDFDGWKTAGQNIKNRYPKPADEVTE